MDGGSKDNSVDIIKEYKDYLSYWESNRDKGQADAINRGFSISTGDILAWLNSDDMYLPGTLSYISSIFMQGNIEKDMRIVFGNCIHVNEEKIEINGSNVRENHKNLDLTLCDYIIQPSCFWTRKTFESAGQLDETLNYGFDWEWFIRASRKGAILQPVDKFLSIYRFHLEHKTRMGGEERIRELGKIYGKFHSEKMALTYLRFKAMEDKIKRIHRLLRRFRINKVVSPQKITYFIYFRGIKWKEFECIQNM
jgi:glycosyltransferase involved in cell wall biosynthesis